MSSPTADSARHEVRVGHVEEVEPAFQRVAPSETYTLRKAEVDQVRVRKSNGSERIDVEDDRPDRGAAGELVLARLRSSLTALPVRRRHDLERENVTAGHFRRVLPEICDRVDLGVGIQRLPVVELRIGLGERQGSVGLPPPGHSPGGGDFEGLVRCLLARQRA